METTRNNVKKTFVRRNNQTNVERLEKEDR